VRYSRLRRDYFPKLFTYSLFGALLSPEARLLPETNVNKYRFNRVEKPSKNPTKSNMR
jgi:hypothetical protein